MKEFSVCYDKFCLGRFALTFEEEGNVTSFEGLGRFEMYLLGMWSDGMVVTMKGYDKKEEKVQFVLLMPDGGEQIMAYNDKEQLVISHLKDAGRGRFAYLLDFQGGMCYKGVRGYEEYDEEEELIIGVVTIHDETLTYGGKNMSEVYADFKRVIDEQLI